jgi:predicted nucleic acid-binding protein
MKAFLDSSSLIKLYYPEDDSEQIEKYIDENIGEIYLSELAILEFRSALWRKVRMKEVAEEIAREAMICFNNDSSGFRWIRLNNTLIISAKDLLMKYGFRGLRTLDSIQLAAAITLKSKDTVFLTADDLLKTFFLKEGLKIP